MNTIEMFLDKWKSTNIEIYTSIIEDYNELRAESWRLMEKHNLQVIHRGHDIPQEYLDIKHELHIFKLELSKQVLDIVMRSSRSENSNIYEYLEPIIERERKSKLDKFNYKINSKVGEILDASNLHIGMDGNINGYIMGERGKLSIRTILSGGYNIQCLHYRILVKTL